MKPYYDRDNITIFCGDCLEIMPQVLKDNSIDLTVTSPPYDNLREYNGYTFEFEPIARELWRVTGEGGVVVWVIVDQTVNGSETLTSFIQALYFRELGFNVHDTMIWNKGGFTSPETTRYPLVFEYMFVFSKSSPKVFNGIIDRVNKKRLTKLIKPTKAMKNGSREKVTGIDKKPYRRVGMRFNVWDVSPEQSNTLRTSHPAQFPEALARDHIISWSNPGDIVLDPMVGSGTTLKMAQQLGRQGIGIDISEEYCALAVDRLRQPSFFSIPSNGKVKTEAKQLTLTLDEE